MLQYLEQQYQKIFQIFFVLQFEKLFELKLD